MGRASRRKRDRERPESDDTPDLADITHTPPLRLSLATFPGSDENGGFLVNDLELVKSAILYADEIDLWSAGAALVHKLEELRKGGVTSIFEFMSAMSPAARRHLNLPHDLPQDLPPGYLDALPVLGELAGELIPAITDPVQRDAVQRVQEILSSFNSKAAAGLDNVAQMLNAPGMNDLWPAIRRRHGNQGIVRPRFLSDTSDDNWEPADLSPLFEKPPNFVPLVRRWFLTMQRLLDEGGALLLDRQVGIQVRALLEKGFILPPDTARPSAAAKLGSHLLIELPAFPYAPLDELLDVRDEHDAALRRYRIAVAALAADKLTGEPFSTEWDDQVRTIKAEQIDPAVQRIQDELTDSTFTKQFAKSFKTEARFLVLGGASLTGFFGVQGNTIAAAVSALGSTAAPTISAAVNAKANLTEQRQRSDRDGLSYLVKVNKDLAARRRNPDRPALPPVPAPTPPPSITPPALTGTTADQLLHDLGQINPHLNHRRSITRARSTMDDLRRGRPEPIVISNVQTRYSNDSTVQLDLEQAEQILTIIRAAYAIETAPRHS